MSSFVLTSLFFFLQSCTSQRPSCSPTTPSSHPWTSSADCSTGGLLWGLVARGGLLIESIHTCSSCYFFTIPAYCIWYDPTLYTHVHVYTHTHTHTHTCTHTHTHICTVSTHTFHRLDYFYKQGHLAVWTATTSLLVRLLNSLK